MRYSTYQSNKLNPVLVIIGINLIVFVVAYIFLRSTAFDAYRVFIYQFGLPADGLLERPWTIVTSMFIHAGWGHIIANMLTLYFFGSYLFRLVGEGRFLIIYFGGGILGSIFFALLSSSSLLAVGASGAIFALAGTLVMMRPKLKVFVFPIPVPLPLWVAVMGGFLILSFLPFVAWQAHLGGLVLGLIAGYFYRKRERHFY